MGYKTPDTLAWVRCLYSTQRGITVLVGLLLGISSNFRTIPQQSNQVKGFFRRIGTRFRYGFAWFWAALFLVCCVILIYISIRSIFILF